MIRLSQSHGFVGHIIHMPHATIFPSQKMPSLEFGTRVLYLLISLMMCIVFQEKKHFNAMNMYFQKLHLYNSNDLVKYSYYILPCLNISNTRNPTTSPSDFPLGADIQDIAAFHKEDTRPFHQRSFTRFSMDVSDVQQQQNSWNMNHEPQKRLSRWWFQPLRKILVKMGIFPK